MEPAKNRAQACDHGAGHYPQDEECMQEQDKSRERGIETRSCLHF
jgi:hypothetical protein